MEQINSPYRNKTEEKTVRLPQIIRKTLKQIIGCTILFVIVFVASKTEFVQQTSMWRKMMNIAKDDITFEEVYLTFNEAVSYIKLKVKEFNDDENQKIITDNEQMQLDVEEIKKVTKILRPVSGKATSRFGKRKEADGTEKLHTGVDLEADVGTPVKASISGVVFEVKELENSFGKFVRIKNGDIITTYAHCSEIEVNEGDKVSQGEVIAYAGDTGNATGPHLHFEITKDGRYVDPRFLLNYN